jgi:hypothetical protein
MISAGWRITAARARLAGFALPMLLVRAALLRALALLVRLPLLARLMPAAGGLLSARLLARLLAAAAGLLGLIGAGLARAVATHLLLIVTHIISSAFSVLRA